jgi:hypothetical protein
MLYKENQAMGQQAITTIKYTTNDEHRFFKIQ